MKRSNYMDRNKQNAIHNGIEPFFFSWFVFIPHPIRLIHHSIRHNVYHERRAKGKRFKYWYPRGFFRSAGSSQASYQCIRYLNICHVMVAWFVLPYITHIKYYCSVPFWTSVRDGLPLYSSSVLACPELLVHLSLRLLVKNNFWNHEVLVRH